MSANDLGKYNLAALTQESLHDMINEAIERGKHSAKCEVLEQAEKLSRPISNDGERAICISDLRKIVEEVG